MGWVSVPLIVLLIEDDNDIRKSLKEMLEDDDLVVMEGCNGQEGLDAMEQCTPDYILLDLMLPVMNGFEFRAAQLADPRFASIPTIVMTGLKDLAEIRATNPLAVVAKPFAVKTLLGFLKAVS